MDTEFNLWAPLVIAVVFPVLGAFATVIVMRTRMEGLRERVKELITDLKDHDTESGQVPSESGPQRRADERDRRADDADRKQAEREAARVMYGEAKGRPIKRRLSHPHSVRTLHSDDHVLRTSLSGIRYVHGTRSTGNTERVRARHFRVADSLDDCNNREGWSL